MSGATTSPTFGQSPLLTEQHCTSVTCTVCGQHYADDFTHHFAAIEDALRALANHNWLVDEHEVWCPECADDAGADLKTAIVDRCEFCEPPLFPELSEVLPDSCRCTRQLVVHSPAPFTARTNPGFEPHHCLTVECGDCGSALGDDESTAHYPSAQAALDAAAEAQWLIARPHLIVCQRCANRRSCTVLGHSWPQQPTFERDGIDYRRCLRGCDEIVTTPAADRSQPWP